MFLNSIKDSCEEIAPPPPPTNFPLYRHSLKVGIWSQAKASLPYSLHSPSEPLTVRHLSSASPQGRRGSASPPQAPAQPRSPLWVPYRRTRPCSAGNSSWSRSTPWHTGRRAQNDVNTTASLHCSYRPIRKASMCTKSWRWQEVLVPPAWMFTRSHTENGRSLSAAQIVSTENSCRA